MEKQMSNVNLSADISTTFASTEDKPFDFELIGYTGKVMEKHGWRGIFSIDGMEAKGGKVVILREHERDRIVGYGDVFKDERGFGVRGKFSKTTKDGIEVAGLLGEGIPLQCSVGISPESMRASERGETVNNFSVPNGIEVWEKSYVGEVSICSWGVDTDTSVHSFAKEIDMTDEIKEIKEVEETTEEEKTEEKRPCECEGDCTCEKEETKEEETEEKIEETESTEEKQELKFSQSDIDAAVTAERTRVEQIFAADAPIELAKQAITEGMDEGAAFKFFYQSEKGMKADGLQEMAAAAPQVEDNKVAASENDAAELSYTELIDKVKGEQKLSHGDAIKHVMKNHPEAYNKFMS